MTEPAHRSQRGRIAYVPFEEATDSLYRDLGFRCGLEIHQQLATRRKLFCRCPAGLYQREGEFDSQLVRHMRPTLSELGEYDGTALMEFRTRKNITYRIKGETACTYDIDDTPPFALNRDALSIAIEIALLLDASIVGEIHITRKQYLDGSIPTGFQRTAIVGIDGAIPLGGRVVRIIQLSVEEDSCREVSDVGHERVYTTDRLGMPLVETVTHPDMRTPGEAAEAANYVRYLTRSSGKVNTGIGAARQDVNVSIEGGTRVEIKGVQHIRSIPRLTHNEAFRQNALLGIREELLLRVPDPEAWAPRTVRLAPEESSEIRRTLGMTEQAVLVATALPGFSSILSRFTSPGRCFADELSDRLKVVACIEKPNLAHAGGGYARLDSDDETDLRARLAAKPDDAVLVFWGPEADLATAVETIDERCRWAFDGVPNETRKAMPDGTTIFERVLPGPDRMYPDTDTAPIPIREEEIDAARRRLPTTRPADQLQRLRSWGVPGDAFDFILRSNLFPQIERLVESTSIPPRLAGTLFGHTLRSVWYRTSVDGDLLLTVGRELERRKLTHDLLKPLIALAAESPAAGFDAWLERSGFRPRARSEIDRRMEELLRDSEDRSLDPRERRDWIMGRLRPLAIGSVPLRDLAAEVEEALR
jgi:glutamyl-tRNA(Gln) amidotransferase subunit E